MIVKDKDKIIFEILSDENGKCKIKTLDNFYFRLFYLQADRINNLNRKLIEVYYSDTELIEKYVCAENDSTWCWTIHK